MLNSYIVLIISFLIISCESNIKEVGEKTKIADTIKKNDIINSTYNFTVAILLSDLL